MNNKSYVAEEAAKRIIQSTHTAVDFVNQFTEKVFHTRGGRIGSGMGSVIEALWGFYTNKELDKNQGITYELGWIYGHEYNDFACIYKDQEWNPATQAGELFRIEVKSMVASADESKAHFDRLQQEFAANELLGVFLWDWTAAADRPNNVFPAIIDYFVGLASPIAEIRDALHIQRGGTFVQSDNCPDGCSKDVCPHIGEPLNASGIRERRTGPVASKGSNVSYAANFGGMLRMLGSRGRDGKIILQSEYQSNPTKARFIDFMARNFPRVANALS